jgi:peptidoglycan/LPS O-acetylase OafA/YrhL
MTVWRLGYRPALDGVRAIAVLLVMASHFGVPGFAQAGDIGVTIFFTLSGFLITTLLLEERERSGRISLVQFYIRRAVRLLPALLVLLAFVVAFEAAIGQLDFALPRAMAALFYVANWVNETTNLGPLFHTWSLGVEEQFYAVWPLLLIVLMTLSGRRAVFVVALALAGASFAAGAVGVSAGELERSIDALMLGCALAVVATAGRLRQKAWAGWAAYPALAIIAIAALTTWPPPVGRAVGFLAVELASVALILSICAEGSRVGRWLSAAPLAWTGKISYGLYLWHFIVAWIATPALVGASWPVRAAFMTAVSFGLALASWRYVERPVQRWRKRVAAGAPVDSTYPPGELAPGPAAAVHESKMTA